MPSETKTIEFASLWVMTPRSLVNGYWLKVYGNIKSSFSHDNTEEAGFSETSVTNYTLSYTRRHQPQRHPS